MTCLLRTYMFVLEVQELEPMTFTTELHPSP